MPDEESTEPGSTIRAKAGRETRVMLSLVKAVELLEVEVLEALAVEDAAPPHLVWDPEAEAATRVEPALILHETKLKLKAKLRGGRKGFVEAIVCSVKGGPREVRFGVKVDPASVGGEFEVTLESDEPFTDQVTVHDLKLEWFFDPGSGKGAVRVNKTPAPLRLYTGHKAPLKNTKFDSPLPHVGKVHLEHACRWANKATANVGEGPKSIAHQVDNQMRHYVHPSDWTNPEQEFASAYASGSQPPRNYGDLGRVSGGRRGISSLYYPPLEPKEDYEQYYPHYQNNFGWRLLDNVTHTGGRCNQQASLICEILGVLGIEASVYYLQRVGYGKRTGRPVRQFFNCYEGGQFWNFHGIVKVTMGDGSYHMYDGSFSSPPRRKHGDEAWAIGERGPFIYSWSPWWQYQDAPNRVPEDDIPDTWEGVP